MGFTCICKQTPFKLAAIGTLNHREFKSLKFINACFDGSKRQVILEAYKNVPWRAHCRVSNCAFNKIL